MTDSTFAPLLMSEGNFSMMLFLFDMDLLNDKGKGECRVNSYLNTFVCY